MRVTFLTQYYPPEMGAPQARISEFARGLAQRGWDVTVLTAMPNYPAGRVFPEYRGRWYASERVNDVNVRRVPIRPSGSGRVSSRLAAALSFAASATVAGLCSLRRGGVLITESPPLTLGPAGALITRLGRCTHVLNISDLWPRSLVEMGVLRNGPLVRASEAVEALSYRSAALITAQSPDIVREIRQRFPDRDVRLLSNGVDTDRFRPDLRSDAVRSSLGASHAVLVTYAGLHGLAQGLDAILDAAHRLRGKSGVEFLLIGDGPAKPRLVDRARELGLKNVRFLPPAPRDRIAALLASSDIALITLSQSLLGAIPSKVYEAMASGVPIVAATGGGAAEMVGEAGAGISVQPGDAAEIADAVARLAADPALRGHCGAAGRRLACERYDRRIWIDRLAHYLETTAAVPTVVAEGSQAPGGRPASTLRRT
jgi:glycosyltransferase involved in cell wall biosynthesis